MTIPVPTLSSAGWVTLPEQKADMLASHMYETDASQSYLYDKNLTSIPHLIAIHGHDVNKTGQMIKDAYETYLGRYYDSVSVDYVTNDGEPEALDGRITVTVKVSVIEDGREYSFSQLIKSANSKFIAVTSLNNTGSLPL